MQNILLLKLENSLKTWAICQALEKKSLFKNNIKKNKNKKNKKK
jgi:hypothetical protein